MDRMMTLPSHSIYVNGTQASTWSFHNDDESI